MSTKNLPGFYVPSFAGLDAWMKKQTAAGMLNIGIRQLNDKLIDSGMLATSGNQVSADEVRKLAAMEHLYIEYGEVTVLRTSGAWEHPHDSRTRIGAHLNMDDNELADTTLRAWRGDPDRIVANGLFLSTVATFPFALWDIDSVADTYGDGRDVRYGFEGTLLARLRYREDAVAADDRVLVDLGLPYVAVLGRDVEDATPELLQAVHALMSHRVAVVAGGPIGYLSPGDPGQPSPV